MESIVKKKIVLYKLKVIKGFISNIAYSTEFIKKFDDPLNNEYEQELFENPFFIQVYNTFWSVIILDLSKLYSKRDNDKFSFNKIINLLLNNYIHTLVST